MQNKYVIGYTRITKKTGEIQEGIYGRGSFGLPVIITPKTKNEGLEMFVFNNIDECQDYCRLLSRAYRRDDVWANSRLKSAYIRRFYPLKVESSKRFFSLVHPHTNKIKTTIKKESQDLYINKEINYYCYEYILKI